MCKLRKEICNRLSTRWKSVTLPFDILIRISKYSQIYQIPKFIPTTAADCPTSLSSAPRKFSPHSHTQECFMGLHSLIQRGWQGRFPQVDAGYTHTSSVQDKASFPCMFLSAINSSIIDNSSLSHWQQLPSIFQAIVAIHCSWSADFPFLLH
jgi:hypothetical protein